MRFLKSERFGIILSNTASQFAIRFITSSTAFFITLLITYIFGIHVFGSFTKITTFVSFFYLLVNFGINAAYIKDYLHHTEKFLFNVILLRVFLALSLFILIAIITGMLPYHQASDTGFSPFEKLGIMVFALSLFSQALVASMNILYQKHLIYWRAIIPNVLSSLSIILFVSIGVLYKNILIVLLSYSISGVIFFLSSYHMLKKKLQLILVKKNIIAFSKKLLTSSLPLALLLSFNLIYFRADTFILSLYKPSFDVGVYGFSYKMFEFIIALPTFFSNSIYPILIEKENNHKEFYEHVRNYSVLLVLLSIPITIAVLIFSPLIQILRKDLIFSVAPLRILSFSLPFFFLTSILQWVLVIKNRKYTLVMLYFISMVVNIMLDIIFIPKFSYIAAAYITVGSEVLVFILIVTVIVFFTDHLGLKRNV